MDEDKLKHSLAVAKKMIKIAREKGLNDKETLDCFFIGFVHEIGSEFAKNNKELQNKISAGILKNAEFKYWQEILYQGEYCPDFESVFLDILNEAELQIDEKGNDVGFDKRLEEIKDVYGEKSKKYSHSKVLVKKIRNEL